MARYAKFFSVGGGAGPNGLQLPLGTVLDATLRQVQDGLGTGSPLYLSTGGLRVGTTAGSAMYWDDTNNRLGIGTNAPANNLSVIDSTSGSTSGDKGITVGNSNTAQSLRFGSYFNIGIISGPSGPLMIQTPASNKGVSISTGYTIPSGMLHIVGSGSTSATTSLLVQNSAGTQSLKVTDSGFVNVGDYASNFGGLAVPFDGVSYGTKPFIVTQRDGVALLSMISTSILEISAPSLRVQPIIRFQNVNTGLSGPDAQNINQSSILLSSAVNAYNGISQNDACNLVYIQNRGTTLQAAGSINWIKMDGVVNELGGGGNKWCTGIYYNPTLIGGALLANSHYCYHATSGQMMVNTTSPNASAQLQVDSTTRGFLPPRVTTAQKNAISSPATGLMVFDTDLVRPCFFNGATWTTL